jgi:hypothetical protein
MTKETMVRVSLLPSSGSSTAQPAARGPVSAETMVSPGGSSLFRSWRRGRVALEAALGLRVEVFGYGRATFGIDGLGLTHFHGKHRPNLDDRP